jgi:hypothetical protein
MKASTKDVVACEECIYLSVAATTSGGVGLSKTAGVSSSTYSRGDHVASPPLEDGGIARGSTAGQEVAGGSAAEGPRKRTKERAP